VTDGGLWVRTGIALGVLTVLTVAGLVTAVHILGAVGDWADSVPGALWHWYQGYYTAVGVQVHSWGGKR
jgi:hypothetical protein